MQSKKYVFGAIIFFCFAGNLFAQRAPYTVAAIESDSGLPVVVTKLCPV
jgi:hypothetical protein